MDGRGFQPQFLSDTPGFHSDNMAARWWSRRARCMTGRDERERAVHCANRERREGGPHRSGPFVVMRPWGAFSKTACYSGRLLKSLFFHVSVNVFFIFNPTS